MLFSIEFDVTVFDVPVFDVNLLYLRIGFKKQFYFIYIPIQSLIILKKYEKYHAREGS